MPGREPSMSILWDDYSARVFHKFSGRRGPFRGCTRAWFAILREWVLDTAHFVLSIVLPAWATGRTVVLDCPPSRPVRYCSHHRARPVMMTGSATALAPPGRLTRRPVQAVPL
jgi:hypothetical protein